MGDIYLNDGTFLNLHFGLQVSASSAIRLYMTFAHLSLCSSNCYLGSPDRIISNFRLTQQQIVGDNVRADVATSSLRQHIEFSRTLKQHHTHNTYLEYL